MSATALVSVAPAGIRRTACYHCCRSGGGCSGAYRGCRGGPALSVKGATPIRALGLVLGETVTHHDGNNPPFDPGVKGRRDESTAEAVKVDQRPAFVSVLDTETAAIPRERLTDRVGPTEAFQL